MLYKELLASSILFLLIDSMYLTSMTPHFTSMVMTIQKSPLKLNMLYTAVVYVFLISGLYYFILRHRNTKTVSQLTLDAGILGFVIYGVYDFTNIAIFKDWDLKGSLIDTVWGAILHASTVYATLQLV